MKTAPWTAAGLAVAVLAMAPLAAQAELTSTSATSFVSTFRKEIHAPPADAWKAIVQLPRWWNSSHTWSGQAANMQLDPQAGGCWCERWGDGHSVQHGRVVLSQPGRVLRLDAALGPLQELAVNGVLTWVTSTQEGKHFLRVTYRVAGAPEAGLEKMAPAVDRVLGEQFERLSKFIETGRAD